MGTAATFMGSGVSESHERSVEFCVHCELLGSCRFARPQSESVFVFVFDCLRHRLPSSSSVSVVVPGGWSVCLLTVGPMFYIEGLEPPWRACSKFVRYSEGCGIGELIVKRLLLCCDVLP